MILELILKKEGISFKNDFMYKSCIIGILFTWLAVLFTSCNDNKYHNEFLDKITENIIAENKSSIYFTKYFCRCKDGDVGLLDFKELKLIHHREQVDMDYKKYLKKLFSEKITVDWDDIQCFNLDKDVNIQYESLSFEDFKMYYWREMPDGALLSKNTTTNENINSVAYFMFKNYFLIADSPDEQFGFVCYHYKKLIE